MVIGYKGLIAELQVEKLISDRDKLIEAYEENKKLYERLLEAEKRKNI